MAYVDASVSRHTSSTAQVRSDWRPASEDDGGVLRWCVVGCASSHASHAKLLLLLLLLLLLASTYFSCCTVISAAVIAPRHVSHVSGGGALPRGGVNASVFGVLGPSSIVFKEGDGLLPT
ncbi:hypothetical protein FALCPG4_003061 [Fusarium falciforme]